MPDQTAGTVAAPRMLCIMGSGETTPTMARLHRDLLARAGSSPAVILDTPYGFQSNASEISARAVRYFKESAGRDVGLASLRRAEGASGLAVEKAQATIAEAGWVFSGPGSPTYALRQWRATAVPRLLADKISSGGCLIFSSAAALTLGRWTVPVYEIYKAGEDPAWCDGLNLLACLGQDLAVIPHYDNAEGGTHDTRYCYLGEGRLRLMESQLPPGGWVLGVDEHTACVLDFDAGSLAVGGLGSVTVRRGGQEVKLPAGEVIALADLRALTAGLVGGPLVDATASGAPAPIGPLAEAPAPSGAMSLVEAPASGSPTASGPRSAGALPVAEPLPGVQRRSPFLAEVAALSASFDEALVSSDPGAATEAALGLESSLHEWSADTFESDELDRGRAALRWAVLRLGEVAGPGMVSPRDLAAPWVEALLSERDEARRSGRFADADRIRDRLVERGVEVRDTPTGTHWDLRQRPRAGPAPS